MKKRFTSFVRWFICAFGVLGITIIFVTSVSAYWGWYFIGLSGLALLCAGAFDYRADFIALMRGESSLSKRERFHCFYYYFLTAVSVVVNGFLYTFLGLKWWLSD